jgi:glyoxylase-like metal-dependent hydrolase (beta-lactamase superfamily II)
VSGLEVIQVRYGERVTQKSAVFHDYASYGKPDGDLQMDYNFWILRDAETTMLLDTGYDIAEQDWLGEQPVISTPAALELLGIDPLDVSIVVASHFHYDHIGYLKLFTRAQVVAGVDEHRYWFDMWDDEALDGEFTTAEHLAAVRRAEQEGRLRLVSTETQVHPAITVYPVGGHSPGELVTRAEGRSGPLILAADAAHFYEQIEHEWPFFAFTDLQEMREGLSFINRLAAEISAAVIPGHDGRVRDRFPSLSGPAAEYATVLG